MANDYAAALVAHDPSDVPLASNIVTVENARKIARGEGLWRTATGGPTEFQIHVPDPVSQQVGLMAMMEVDGKPALVGIRLKREGGRIVEAEHMVAGNLSEAALANLRTPRQHELFKLGSNAGLSSVLAGRVGIEAIARVPALLGLSVLPAGAVPPNPQELLGRAGFSELMQTLSREFDVVIIDTPAAGEYGEAE